MTYQIAQQFGEYRYIATYSYNKMQFGTFALIFGVVQVCEGISLGFQYTLDLSRKFKGPVPTDKDVWRNVVS